MSFHPKSLQVASEEIEVVGRAFVGDAEELAGGLHPLLRDNVHQHPVLESLDEGLNDALRDLRRCASLLRKMLDVVVQSFSDAL